jgi:hypothetical protein
MDGTHAHHVALSICNINCGMIRLHVRRYRDMDGCQRKNRGALPGVLTHSTTSRQIPELMGSVVRHVSCSSASSAMFSTAVLDNGECLFSQRVRCPRLRH